VDNRPHQFQIRSCAWGDGTTSSSDDPGGRFNVGDIDRARYPAFPALYIASDKGTALAEVLGREKRADSLTPEELALTKPDSITAASVSGKLEWLQCQQSDSVQWQAQSRSAGHDQSPEPYNQPRSSVHEAQRQRRVHTVGD
jgi:RES domain-containing protein